MKQKSIVYAKALADLAQGATSVAQQKKIVDGFLKLLEKNGDFKKIKEVVALTERLLLKQTGNKKITFETARAIDSKSFIKTFAKKGDIIEEQVKPELIAGVRVVVNGEQQLDFSLQNKLNNIFQ